MGMPSITHLQFIILGELFGREAAGHELRAKLRQEGINKSRPAFYQLMSRLESQKLVKGWYENRLIEDQVVRERRYGITAAGRHAVTEYVEFAGRRSANIAWEA